MSNEEPQATQEQNVQIASEGHKLPEQSLIPQCNIPRPFDFDHLIHQWQPMGIRVTLNLPFTGNDQDYIFAIRNGPFIPTMFYIYKDTSAETQLDGSGILDPTKRKLNQLDSYSSYAFNNMRNVIHAGKNYSKVEPDKDGKPNTAIYITQYDQPPILASFATMFRKWRGSMHYRVRTVAGFTTQGYIFSSLVRNSPSIIGLYPTQNMVPGILREDRSYRESMINSYVMGDTAMFRHFEVEVPFEYPVPYYDQFNWIANRSRPANNFMWNKPKDKDVETARLRNIRNEPHGDNYVLFGLRGKLESSVQNSQITFELEYRAGDDFQFADPFLPFNAHYLVPYADYVDQAVKIIQVPSSDYYTDGLHYYQKTSKSSQAYVDNMQTTTTTPAPVAPQLSARLQSNTPSPRRATPLRRLGRDTSRYEGRDEVDSDNDYTEDDLKSEIGDEPDLLEVKRNLRKSLRVRYDLDQLAKES